MIGVDAMLKIPMIDIITINRNLLPRGEVFG